MGKLFIEVTDRTDKTKKVVNINHIVSIGEEKNGLAFVEIAVNKDTTTSYGFACSETYVELFNYLVDLECV